MLLSLFHQGEAYGRAASRNVGCRLIRSSASLIERAGALEYKCQGRALVYSWNPKSLMASRLRDLVGVAYDGLDSKAWEALFQEYRQTRSK